MYNLRPSIKIKKGLKSYCGFAEISKVLLSQILSNSLKTIVFEFYPGINTEILLKEIIKKINPKVLIDASLAFLESGDINTKLKQDLTEDRVFGRFTHQKIEEYIDIQKVSEIHEKVENTDGTVIIYGVGASKIVYPDLLIYVNITRWEIQTKLKNGLSNWKADNKNEEFSKKVKRSYYFEWPVADQIKQECYENLDFMIDLNNDKEPKMISGKDYKLAIKEFTTQPFRLVPYFDPGLWGGSWMQEKFKVRQEEKNLAWSFDGVPEENSVIFEVNTTKFEVPASDIVMLFPKALLGNRVYGLYGSDFPIRFDYLDTMGGQNLSLQVHPTLDYAYRTFGAKYTQDESYYIMDCKENSIVYLGLKEGVNLNEIVNELEQSQVIGKFDEDKYVNSIKVKKHDHLLIPAGTIHSSGKDCVVLEISSTPNRFTFKLWDWDRVDIDGKPRPIHINHGKKVLNVDIDEKFVNENLYNQFKINKENNTVKEEHTGLYESQPIETVRHIFSTSVLHKTEGSVNMLNLVEGEQIIVESLDNKFEPFIVNYGETFIIPESLKVYNISPFGKSEGKEVITMKAYIR
ncbi:MAG: class I mannose-6-phosphate isomerase [Romboutsia sp.]